MFPVGPAMGIALRPPPVCVWIRDKSWPTRYGVITAVDLTQSLPLVAFSLLNAVGEDS